jgi:hypothetical protein
MMLLFCVCVCIYIHVCVCVCGWVCVCVCVCVCVVVVVEPELTGVRAARGPQGSRRYNPLGLTCKRDGRTNTCLRKTRTPRTGLLRGHRDPFAVFKGGVTPSTTPH